jgi:negative regulator of flagellin synthesis FlgM
LGVPVSSSTLREFANQTSRRSESANTAVLDDTVEISELASFLSRLSELPEVRARRIVNIRNEILDGSYVTPDKLDIASERLLNDLGD